MPRPIGEAAYASEEPGLAKQPKEEGLVFDVAVAHWRAADETPQYLREHLTGVGGLARRFASKLGVGSAGEVVGPTEFGEVIAAQVGKLVLQPASGSRHETGGE